MMKAVVHLSTWCIVVIIVNLFIEKTIHRNIRLQTLERLPEKHIAHWTGRLN